MPVTTMIIYSISTCKSQPKLSFAHCYWEGGASQLFVENIWCLDFYLYAPYYTILFGDILSLADGGWRVGPSTLVTRWQGDRVTGRPQKVVEECWKYQILLISNKKRFHQSLSLFQTPFPIKEVQLGVIGAGRCLAVADQHCLGRATQLGAVYLCALCLSGTCPKQAAEAWDIS